jgi:hypothetical protein
MISGNSLARHALRGIVVGVLISTGCASNNGDEASVTGGEELGAPCSFSVKQNTYDGPNYWGTIAFTNGSKAVTGITVDFDVPNGAHCTNDSVPSGATLSPLNGSGSSATTAGSHCTFTWAGASFGAGASKTLNYSTDSSNFIAAKNIVVTYASCGGNVGVDAGTPPPPPPPDAGAGGAPKDSGSTDNGNLVWHKASKTNFTSYPDPGSDECIHYNGCLYEGEFAALDGRQSLAWVKSHNIVAVHSKDFNKYKLHNLRLRSGSKTIDVVVYDECADSDCSGCCTQNAKPSGYLIDVESFTDARFGVPDGQIEWACLDPGCQ